PGGNEQDGSGHGAFGPHPGLGVLRQEMIHDGIADLIADLIRMPLGYRLRHEDKVIFHLLHPLTKKNQEPAAAHSGTSSGTSFTPSAGGFLVASFTTRGSRAPPEITRPSSSPTGARP